MIQYYVLKKKKNTRLPSFKSHCHASFQKYWMIVEWNGEAW